MQSKAHVSSAGEYADLLEHEISQYTGSKVAVATSNGTRAHLALEVAELVKINL